jgi:large subunit ribosomal protein L18
MPRDKDARKLRLVRHRRLRQRVSGSSQRPRLSVFRSLKHIYAQVIDDAEGRTLVSASSLETEISPSTADAAKAEVSKLVGSAIAQRALNVGITTVVFDRGGYKYHGRVKVLADAAREGGLVF